ncbi:Putative NTF2-like domain superfamily protein [Septoria linicola]|uniref:NTF2-like domain superfamily protein n=1 Tax=Septoria linicola TaxID=215465 RepID=A0A9Q9AR04_9PEZI|nr:putative NTF2-like domain superfamily protein [Septoria linicola]USW49211.1 Putative NTF2-like domain superfamily protein [Septoria linicola]
MPQSALVVPLPLSPSTLPNHPALQFYSTYGQNFPQTDSQRDTQEFEAFYSADCKTILPNYKIIEGGQASWNFFRKLYAKFPKVEREILSLVVVSSDDGDGGGNKKHSIHAELMTKLYLEGQAGEKDGRSEVVHVPQSFVYVLGKADAGKGTLGWQIRELRNYYDLRTMEGALGEGIV